MSKLVKFNKKGGIISVQITVSTYLPWKYKYVGEKSYEADSENNPPKFPHKYDLGKPEQMNFRNHAWDVYIFNAKLEQDYDVKIAWLQEGNNVPLEEWKVKSKTKEDDKEVITLSDSARFLGV